MKKYRHYIFSILCICLLACSQEARATHSMGADITYKCVGPDTYEITLSFYRDCVGIAADDSAYLSATSSCQGNYYVYLLPVPGTGQEITPLCPSETSTCDGGLFTGIQEYVYKRTVILPGQCFDWTFSYNQCCRNNAITNITTPGTWQMYVYAILNSTITPCNNSPTFSNKPVPFVCLGQQFCFNHGAFDTDGDSLVYSLITPWDSPGLPIQYLIPFNANNPLSSTPNITFNSQTGDICMTPTSLEVTVMAVLVEEYRNGVLIGAVERDIQVTVINCTNQVPAMSGINGTNNFSTVTCAGSQICFTVNSSDANAPQNTYVSWDQSIPGATFNVTAGSRQNGTFCWTPTFADVASSPHCFTVTVHDDNCPIYGSQTYSYCIDVQGIGVTVPNQVVGCNATTNLVATATGGTGYTYIWNTGATTSTINGGAGNYTVTVSDGLCTATTTATISQTPTVNVSAVSTPTSCFGGTNGTATVSANGGTGAYTYNWSPTGGSGITASNLAAGNYTVSVTDAMGCTSTATVTITQPTQITSAASSSPVLCNAGNDGTATVVANNGTPGYTYAWAPSGGNATTATGLAAGVYTVTTTDANGCTTTTSTTVTQPVVLSASASATNVLCNGGTDGTATAVANDGTPGYTYSWSPSGGNAVTANGLAAGIYTVTITDANGCTTSTNTTIAEPTPVAASASATNVLCNAGSDGTATAVANNGSPGYTYLWSPSGGNAANATGLPAGNFTVTVTDANGCTTSATTSVTEPTLLTAAASATNVLCNAGADGTATVVANDGTPGYTYSWAPSGGNAATANGLTTGNYTATVTDANGCTTTTNTTVTEPTLLIAAASTTLVLCNGGNDGTATVVANDGTPGYTYSWSSGGNGTTESGLAAGTYSVTVTDAHGCTTSIDAIVAEPTLLTASTSYTPVLCNGGSDGTATVVANDGTPGYFYSWSSGGNSATETGLIAGTYSVTVTDANGCTASMNETVSEPTLLIAATSATMTLCNGGSDGSATVMANDGTPGYTYSWSSGGNAATESGLAAGNYDVTVTDANGCSTSVTSIVTEPTLLTSSTTSTPVLCNGGSDGTSTVTAVDGTPGYTYSWSSGGNGSIENGIAAGIYVVTVTDVNGCTSVATSLVIEPTLLTAATSTTDVLCNGGSDGTGNVIGNDGTPGYTYSWSSGGNAATETGLAAGNYDVTVTDANGCTTSVTAMVNEPAVINILPLTISCLCNGSANGSASANVTGGVGAYIFSWSPGGGTTATINNLSAGNYTLTVTDDNGCVSSANTTVTEPALLTTVMGSTPTLCNGDSSGSASAIGNGGTGNYIYSWFPSGGNAATAGNLFAGHYSVTITDDNGCVITDTIWVSEPVAISLATNSIPALCGSSNGSATVAVNGGSSPYQYLWSPAGGSSSLASNISAGAYTITVTDANGCTTDAIANVLNTGGPGVNASVVANVSCNGGNDGSASVNVTNGTPPYIYAWSPVGGSAASASGLPAGNYAVTVTDSNGCISSDNVIISEPTPVAAQTTSTNTLCFGSADGTATAMAAGGTAPYTFVWNPGAQAGATATNLATGNYIVIATDANGCTSSAPATVQQPPNLVLAMSSLPALCHGSATGSATVNVSGGTAGYSYSWTPGNANTQSAGNLAMGNYSVVVTDAHGCTSSNAVSVSEPSALNLLTNFTPATCGTSNGSATVNASGGAGPYTYQWTPVGGTNSIAANLNAGSYSVTVTDANGCTGSTNVNISNAGGPIANATVLTNVSCYGGNNGSASLNVSSGNPPFTYVWSPAGGNGTQANGLSAGNYSVVVADAIGCITVANITITEPAEIITSISSFPATCGDANGSASVNASGGTGALSYSWTPSGGTSANANNLTGGNYSVLITDANGCTASLATTVINSGGGVASLQSLNNVTCNGGNDGAAAVSVTGGAAPYTYLWTPGGDTTTSVANISAGNYSVIITDSVGCISSVNVTIVEPPPIQILTSVSPAGCNGAIDGSVYAYTSGGTGPYTYAWSPVTGNDSALTNIAAGNYTVVVTDQNGCVDSTSAIVTSPSSVSLNIAPTNITCFGSADGSVITTVLSGTAPFTFSWSPVGGNNALAENLGPGNYFVTVTDSNGCVSIEQTTITEPPLLVLNVSGDLTLCIGQETTINANASGGTQPYIFMWDNGINTDSQLVSPTTSTTYSVDVIDANGCSLAPQAININVNPPLNVTATSTPEICAGDTANINAIAGGGNGGPYFYSWNNGAIQSDEAMVFPQSDTTFVVTVNDGCSPPVDATINIAVNPLPEANFLPQLLEGCMPVEATFSNHGFVPPGSFYTWNMGDGTVYNNPDVAHTYATPGQYTVSLFISTTEGCTAEITVVDAVNVYVLPVAGFEMSAHEVSILTPSIDFFDQSTEAYTWSWDFGDYNSSNDVNPVHNYADTGSYIIQLIVTTDHGCTDTFYNVLRIKEDFTVFIPNAFTPNLDNINDGFMADGIGWADFEMFIIDRWGLEIYHSLSKDNPWNGTFYDNGTRCQSDVYEYIIRIHDKEGTLHKFLGHVTLVL